MCFETKGRSLLLTKWRNQRGNIGKIYGCLDEFIKSMKLGVYFTKVKQTYNHLNEKIFRNGSLIPSREETSWG